MSDLRTIKFCYLLGKNAAEAVLFFQTAYKVKAMEKIKVYQQFSHLKKGEIKPCSGHPSTSRMDENLKKVHVW